MSDTIESLQRKIKGAGVLHSVVRTMKTLAGANNTQYQQAERALGDYYRSIELGLSIMLRKGVLAELETKDRGPAKARLVSAVVFGSDQGLVGRFNDAIAEFAVNTLAPLSPNQKVWAVGERGCAALTDYGASLSGTFAVPNSVQAIAPLVAQILVDCVTPDNQSGTNELYLIYNRPVATETYGPVAQRLLPLDDPWRRKLAKIEWSSNSLPEALGSDAMTLRALIREYLFVSIFRACAESLASENASRLAAMQRADKNINELLDGLQGTFQRLRQDGIDEELFDLVSGFEALNM